MKVVVTTAAAERNMANRAAETYAPSDLLALGKTLGGPVEDLLARVAQQLVERRDAPVQSGAAPGKGWVSPDAIGIAVVKKAESIAQAKAEAPALFARETVATLKAALVKDAQSGGRVPSNGLFETDAPQFGFVGELGEERTVLKEMQPGFREALDAEMTRVFGETITIKEVELEGEYSHDSDGIPFHYQLNRFRLGIEGESPFLKDLEAASQASREKSVAGMTDQIVERIRTALDNRVTYPQPVGTPLPIHISLTASPSGAKGGFTPAMTTDLMQRVEERVKADSKGLYEVESATLEDRDKSSRYHKYVVVLAASS